MTRNVDLFNAAIARLQVGDLNGGATLLRNIHTKELDPTEAVAMLYTTIGLSPNGELGDPGILLDLVRLMLTAAAKEYTIAAGNLNLARELGIR